MKAILAILLCVAAVSFSALAQSTNVDTVTFEWNASAVPVSKYRLYFSRSTNEWTHVKDAGQQTRATVELVDFGRWYFTVTATDSNGLQSVPSDVVSYEVGSGPDPVSGLRVLSAVVTRVSTVVTSTNLVTVP